MQPLVVALAVVALLVLATAVALTLRRRPAGKATAFAGMRERDFEALVMTAFRAQGYEPIGAAEGASAAGAGQLVVRRERTTFLVECRHVKAAKVGVDAVQALQRAMAARGATAGFVLTAGRFSREAVAFAGGSGIRLVDGAVLHDMLGRAKAR